MPRILPLRIGWEPGPEPEGFYPEGLPEDWRLTYFANTTRGVVLAPATWQAADGDMLARWRDDVHAAFRFYLAVDDGRVAAPLALHAAEILGERLGGWILPDGTDATALRLAPCHRLVCSPEAAARAPAVALAWEVPPALTRDLRGARHAAEQIAAAAGERPAVAVLGRARFADLMRWQSLLELLGV
jgi:hypothetical protein